jgi:hypothetical protein
MKIIQSNIFQIPAYAEHQNAKNLLTSGKDYPQQRSLSAMD